MLKVAVIGTGFISTQKHLPAWRRLRRSAEVVALCDVNPVRGEEIARRFEVPKVYEEVQVMVEKEQPDLVDICTPPRTHAPIAIQALKGGANVLIEKPMAVSSEECDAIITASQEAGRKVCVAHSDLFYPAFMKAVSLVRQGAIGEFRSLRIFLSTPSDYMTSNADHWAHRLPGGVIGETGPHAVYLTLAFINPIREAKIYARKVLPKYPWSLFEEYHLGLIGEKAISSAILSYTSNQWAAQVDIYGSQGLIKVDLESQSLIRYNRRSLAPKRVGLSALSESSQIMKSLLSMGIQTLNGRVPSTHELLIGQFCESLQNGTPPPVSAQDGKEAVRVMNLIVERLKAEKG